MDRQNGLLHADSHIQELQQRAIALQQKAAELASLHEVRMNDRSQAERELARLHSLIQDTQQQIEEELAAAAERKKTYAIIPYEGPHGTERRPLYIECRSDAVLLQPEGVELALADLRGPTGPGNPLAAAVRAAEGFYRNQSGADGVVRPYPLLLVRPDGIQAYALARRAIEAWSTDFGYELIDGDWELSYPLPKPQLATLEQNAVNLARLRQKALAAAAPRRFGGGGDGFGGSGGGRDDLTGSTSRWGEGDTFGENGTGYGAAGRPAGTSSVPAQLASTRAGLDRAHSGTTDTNAGGYGSGVSGEGVDGAIADATPSAHGGAPVASQQGPYGRVAHDELRDGQKNPLPPHPNLTTTHGNKGTQVAADSSGQHTSPTEGQPNSSASAKGPAGAEGGTSGGGHPTAGAASAAGNNSGGPSVSMQMGGTPAATAAIADQRGANWAVPRAGSGAVPLRRAIHVVVRADRLAILPEQGAGGGEVIPIQGGIESAIDPFATAIQRQIKSWGVAGHGMYWQPLLVLKPGPDGVAHTQSIEQLLQGSGVEIAGQRRGRR